MFFCSTLSTFSMSQFDHDVYWRYLCQSGIREMSPLDYDANLVPAPSLTREFERRLDLGFMVAMDNTIILLLKPSFNAIKLTRLF